MKYEMDKIHQLFRDIMEITDKTVLLLEQEKFDEIDKYMEQRQTLMNQVDAEQQQIPHYQHDEKVQKLIKKIIERNEVLKPLLDRYYHEAKIKLSKLEVSKQAKKKYGPYQEQASGYFFDKQK